MEIKPAGGEMRVRVEVRAREMHAATNDGVTPILGGNVFAFN